MSRPATLRTFHLDTRLRLAAHRALKACSPLVEHERGRRKQCVRNGSIGPADPFEWCPHPFKISELDEARGALMELAEALRQT